MVQIFRIAAFAEAVSWTGLLIGMFLKYATDFGEAGVQLFGPIHGALFVAYIAAAYVVSQTQKWSGKVMLLSLLAAIPPLTTVVFERWASKHGLFEQPATGQQ